MICTIDQIISQNYRYICEKERREKKKEPRGPKTKSGGEEKEETGRTKATEDA